MDFEEMMFMIHLLGKNDLFIDVGANVGVYTLLASGLAGARSMTFEPVPGTFSRLKKHIELNHLENKVECINKGVGDKEDTLLFSTDHKDCLNHVVTPSESAQHTASVPVICLDALENIPAFSMLKLDIEGYEWHALQGATQLLTSGKIKAIVLEFNHHAKRYGIAPDQIEQLLKAAGYSSYQYNPIERTLSPTSFNTQGNSLWIRDIESVLPRVQMAEKYNIYGHSI
jgi:FkbM family methyltransferase